jgi:histidine triad (HIT) family protein
VTADLTPAQAARPSCPFCAIIDGSAPAEIVGQWGEAIAITPLNPVTPGHVLVIPKAHVADATENPNVTAMTMRYAARRARDLYPCNIITSAGAEATQTVRHPHIHIVPRHADDGLALPWTTSVAAIDVMNRYRETLHRWAARYVPEGATVVKVRVEYDDGYDPTFTDRPESLSVMIEYKPGPSYGGYGYAEIEMQHATSIGELLTELFRIEDES